MEKNINSRELWNKAGISGAALGIASSAAMFLQQFISGMSSPIASTALSFILWIIKFGGCIWLMMFFMKKLCREYGNATSSDTFRFGVMTAFLSALIYSAVSLANTLFISADLIETQFAAIMQQYSTLLDANSMSMMEKMENSFPQISFFSNLIYCFIFGTILSAILSRNIPPRNPFAGYRGE